MKHSSVQSLKLCLSIPVLTLAIGCAHTMEVTNLEDYRLQETQSSRIDIAVNPFDGGDSDNSLYYDHIVEGLRRHPSVGRVIQNASASASTRVTIKPTVDYSGSAMNFLIDFPGFLVFANAWNGYVYHANIDAGVTIENGSGAKDVNIPVDYSMRHCDFGRGFWSGSGWWLPGWGATNLIVGGFHIAYDPDATAPLHPIIAKPYGDYVAEMIVRSILGVKTDGGTEPQPSPIPDAPQ